MSLSHIQNQILSILTTSEFGERYSKLQPPNVEKDLFNYHLKFLIEKRFIHKTDRTYSLTNLGKKYVQQMDVRGDYKKYFKFTVLPYVTKKIDGERKIQRHTRIRHPYFGEVTSVSGKVKYGERAVDAATRKLQEETGLVCKNFEHIGVLRSIRYGPDKKIFEDTLYHVCVGNEPDGELVKKTEFGLNEWMAFEEAKRKMQNNVTNSQNSLKIIERIESENFEFFYFEEEIWLKSL